MKIIYLAAGNGKIDIPGNRQGGKNVQEILELFIKTLDI